jgi:hypothetical protein
VLTKKFGIDSIPRVYLIDRNGILRSMEGRRDAEKLIPKLLAEEYKPEATTAGAKTPAGTAAAKPATRPAAAARPSH